ncbi:MAG: AbgT family transporter [Acidobacteriota bacterium]|nr:AbgT family transporter [Acidobacteriota bacterium]MDQ3417492.1 AbgT family transporter [Acidobacteriota bacterium]
MLDRLLNVIERAGNKLPDPAILFVLALLLVWVFSALLAPVAFGEIDPRNQQPLRVQNLLTGAALAAFLANMVSVFVNFPPLGIVLVAMLGVGVAEHVGFIGAGLKAMLHITPRALLTPMLILVACLSHTATDAGYVLVIPLGGIIFYTAGRHPLAGIAAAFAGVSGGFSANFIPSGIDPLLQGFTQTAAQLIDPNRLVNPLSNWYFSSASTFLIVLLGWYLTDRIVEPRVAALGIDGDTADMPKLEPLSRAESRGLAVGGITLGAGLVLLTLWALPATSPLRAPDGQLTVFTAPLMRSIVPLIFLLFLVPGVAYGIAAGTVKTAKDVVTGMSKAMSGMGYYIVMAFFAALFTDAFGRSNLGALFALKGATFLQTLQMPGQVTIVGIIMVTAMVNLLIGSASAKWALLAPIFVPMLMQVGLAPELTQAAYRVGDSTTNIITPLMPYFPLVVVYCQRYVKNAGIGTVASMMLPYSGVFIVTWTIFLLLFWAAGIPLGLQGAYSYP